MTEMNFSYLLDAALHAGLGLATFGLALWVFDRAFRIPWREQILERQNMAVAILGGFTILALGIIVAASVH